MSSTFNISFTGANSRPLWADFPGCAVAQPGPTGLKLSNLLVLVELSSCHSWHKDNICFGNRHEEQDCPILTFAVWCLHICDMYIGLPISICRTFWRFKTCQSTTKIIKCKWWTVLFFLLFANTSCNCINSGTFTQNYENVLHLWWTAARRGLFEASTWKLQTKELKCRFVHFILQMCWPRECQMMSSLHWCIDVQWKLINKFIKDQFRWLTRYPLTYYYLNECL